MVFGHKQGLNNVIEIIDRDGSIILILPRLDDADKSIFWLAKRWREYNKEKDQEKADEVKQMIISKILLRLWQILEVIANIVWLPLVVLFCVGAFGLMLAALAVFVVVYILYIATVRISVEWQEYKERQKTGSSENVH